MATDVIPSQLKLKFPGTFFNSVATCMGVMVGIAECIFYNSAATCLGVMVGIAECILKTVLPRV